jgi:hypothetical protein
MNVSLLPLHTPFRRLLALIAFGLLGRASAETIIVDNVSSGFTYAPTAAWSSATTPSGFYGSSYRFDPTTTADTGLFAQWKPTITTAGYYHIYMRWVAASNRPAAAPLEIAYDGGTQLDTTRTVNQQVNGGVWVLVGTYYLSAGSGNYVKIKGDSAGKTVADAVRFDLSYATGTPAAHAPYAPAQNITGTGTKVAVACDDNGSFSLRVNGAPFIANGFCKSDNLAVMTAAGANSFRTYSVQTLVDDPTILPTAQTLGLKVLIGLNLRHESSSFTYWDNPDIVAQDLAAFKTQIDQFKNEPALLGWAIGNEVDISTSAAPIAIYEAIQDIARAVHEADPFHPTVSVHAGSSPTKIQRIRQYAPDIDLVAANSYAHAGDVDDNVTDPAKGGWTGAYLITEFSIDQASEVSDASLTYWKAIPEPTSDQKKSTLYYRYLNITPTPTLRKQCVGTYVFATTDTFRVTHTWYNLLTPNSTGADGTTPGYDALYHAWKGVNPPASAPTLQNLTINGTASNVLLRLGQSVTAAATATGSPVKYTFELRREVGLQSNVVPAVIPVYSGNSASITFTTPNNPASDFGNYRLFCYAEDSAGRVGSANLPLRLFKGTGTTDTVSITTQPADKMAKQGDNNVAFVVTATGSGALSYQWYQLNYGRYHNFDYNPIAGATSSTLTLNSVSSTDDAGTYAVAVTDANNTLLSTDVILKVLVPARIATQPANVTAPSGGTAVFTVAIDSASPKVTYPLEFQWMRNGVDLSTTAVPSAKCRTLLLDPVQSGDNGAVFSVKITNSVSLSATNKLPQTITSTGGTLTVQP